MKPDVSIILLTINGGNRLEELMQSIRTQRYNGKMEVIAIDSGSQDDTVEILDRYGAKMFKIKPHEFHHSRTRNLGAQKSKGDILVYITQDALPVDDCFLINLLKPLDNESADVVYGRQIANHGAKKMDIFFYSYYYPEKKQVLKKKHANNPKKFYMDNIFVSDVCSAIKREVWNAIPFDDGVPMAEDKDFALRALQAGYKLIYEPEAAVYHSHDYSLSSLFKRRFKDGAAFASIALEGEDNFVNKGMSYFLEQMRYFIKNKYFFQLPYALIYNFVYFFAVFLGSNQRYLPGFIKNPLLKN